MSKCRGGRSDDDELAAIYQYLLGLLRSRGIAANDLEQPASSGCSIFIHALDPRKEQSR